MYGLFKNPDHISGKGFNSVKSKHALSKKGSVHQKSTKSQDIKKAYVQSLAAHKTVNVEKKIEEHSMEKKAEKYSVEKKAEKDSVVKKKAEKYSVEKKVEKDSVEKKKAEKYSVEKKAEEHSMEKKVEEHSIEKKVEEYSMEKISEEYSVEEKVEEHIVEKEAEPKRYSRQEIDVDESTREIIAARLKQINKSTKSITKRSTIKRTKHDVKLAVLARFEALAEKNPDFRYFIESHPDYLETIGIDELRESEYTRLDNLGHIYLDYTGGSLYPESLVRRHADLLAKNVFGNPHSSNPSSSASTVYETKVRQDILEFFGANPSEYEVAFTSNASGALKLVGESYPFSPSRKFLLTWDSHNSVNGIREFAKQKGSEVVYVMLEASDARVKKDMLKEGLDNGGKREDCGLFALTGQSNVTGVKAELSWTKYAKARGWDVLLDAAALAPTTPIDLSKYPVDFMAISFYKMFGYPTGAGCLVMRKTAASKLQRPWFGGGTVDLVSLPGDAYTSSAGYKRFEDGTLNYLSLSAVSLGLAFLQPMQKTLSDRITILTEYLIKELTSLRHGTTGHQLVNIAGPKNTYLRGGTISFYLTDADGNFIPHLLVERLANKQKISLRSGCLCNPGATTAGMKMVDRLSHIDPGMPLSDFLGSFDEYMILLLRISVGIASNWEDCEAIVNLLKKLLDPVYYEEAKKEVGDLTITSLC
jgi:selenocysteine lyase/cysteine desulfurase